MQSKTTFIQKIGLILFGLLLSFLLIEGGLQISSILYRGLCSYRSIGNADFVIFSIGDSTTFGLGTTPEFTYSRILENMLNDRSTTTRFHVVNCGIPGQTSTGVLQRIDRQMIAYRPDIVISLFGVNDFNERLNTINTTTISKHGYFYFMKDFRICRLYALGLDLALKDLKINKAIKVEDMEDMYAIYYRQLRYNYYQVIDRVKNKYHAKIVVMRYISPGSEKINAIIEDIARENNVVCADFKGLVGREDLISKDEFHPNKTGHTLIARSLFAALTDNQLLTLE